VSVTPFKSTSGPFGVLTYAVLTMRLLTFCATWLGTWRCWQYLSRDKRYAATSAACGVAVLVVKLA
jgi:hypothetical protein